MLFENGIVDKEKIEEKVLFSFENSFGFGTVAIVQVVEVHEIHRFVPSILLRLISNNLFVELGLEDAFALIEFIGEVEENILELYFFN